MKLHASHTNTELDQVFEQNIRILTMLMYHSKIVGAIAEAAKGTSTP